MSASIAAERRRPDAAIRGRLGIEVKLAYKASEPDLAVVLDLDRRMGPHAAFGRIDRQALKGDRSAGLLRAVPCLARKLQESIVMRLKPVVALNRCPPGASGWGEMAGGRWSS